jgi:hypothetical protein
MRTKEIGRTGIFRGAAPNRTSYQLVRSTSVLRQFLLGKEMKNFAAISTQTSLAESAEAFEVQELDARLEHMDCQWGGEINGDPQLWTCSGGW